MSSPDGSPTLAERRAAVDAAIGALQDLSAVLHQAPSDRLGELAGTLGQLAALATAAVVQVTAEAEQRGVISQSQCASTAGWVRDQVRHLLTGGSAVVARCAAILHRPDLTVLAEAIRSTDVTPTVAVTIAAEYDKLAADLVDGAGPIVLDAMINVGAEQGVSAVRGLRELLLTRYGRDGAFQDEQDTTNDPLTCPPASSRPGCSGTNSPWTGKATPCWKPPSGRCPSRNPDPTVNPIPAPSGGAADKPSSNCAAAPSPQATGRRPQRNRSCW